MRLIKLIGSAAVFGKLKESIKIKYFEHSGGFYMTRVSKNFQKLFYLLAVLLLFSGAAVQAQKKKSDKPAPQGKPVLWEAVNISRQDLINGTGGTRLRPNLSSITFIEEEKGGSNLKYRIKDGAGKIWITKTGKEAQSETASVRLLGALGYKTELVYLVPSLTIPGKGTFQNVRLEARPDNIERLEEWDWKSNPFTGTQQLQGLKVMMALVNNWDLKTDNNKILYSKNERETHYIISDLGATFGKMGGLPFFWRIQRSRNAPSDYVDTRFIKEVDNGQVEFAYYGKLRELYKNMPVRDVRWITNLLSQLSQNQIRDAFRSANYSASEVDLLSQEVRERIGTLNSVIRQGNAGDGN